MNVKLLRRIAREIQKQPTAFDMRWLHTKDGAACNFTELDCGTAHCICGWAAVLLKNSDIQNNRIGHEVFGIDEWQASRLFFVRAWPDKFAQLYGKRKTPQAKAKVAAARIEHFIATGGE